MPCLRKKDQIEGAERYRVKKFSTLLPKMQDRMFDRKQKHPSDYNQRASRIDAEPMKL